MRYGRLDRRITLQRKAVTEGADGSPVETWSDIGQRRRWASLDTPSGDEKFSAPQIAAKQTVEFQIRWAAGVADLSPLDRVVYPAVGEGSPTPAIPAGSIYDIAAVHEIGRREGLKIIAFRRADV